MSVTITKYSQFNKAILSVLNNPAGSTLKLALVGSGYTFSAAHTDWSTSVESYEITGTGYTAGGQALANLALNGHVDNATIVDGDFWLDADDVLWSAATLTARRGILYNATTGELLASILFDDTPADISVTDMDMLVQWSELGLLQLD